MKLMKLRNLSLISVCCALLALTLRAQFSQDAASDRAAVKAAAAAAASRTPPEHRRSTELTFLTLPEWYLVYSPDEYANFIAEKPPSEFPFLGHLDQFWHGYRVVHEATRTEYPFNTDYHVMIWVIGTSTTIEYVLKWGYETLVGRVAEASRRGDLTPEDRLAAQTARAYVDFLDVEPWYKFDFMTPLKKLWTETGWWGPDPIRKWERKYYLTCEFAAKGAYGWLIKKASESAYEEEKPVTAVLLDRLSDETSRQLPDLRVLRPEPEGAVLALMPRYQAFARYAQTLAKAGVNFREIAGNRGVILISAVVPVEFDDAAFDMVMRQPIMTRPGLRRIVFTVPVAELGAMLRRHDRPPFRLEHIYDY